MSVSNFEITEKLGEGTYSTVYRVVRRSDNETYAFKRVQLLNLKEKEKANALTEVRLLASLNHPNVVGYKEAFFDEPSSSLCIVMEFANDGDLLSKVNQHKKNRTRFPEQDIWSFLIQAVHGLNSLHQLHIVHRDIKSANLFLTSQGQLKIGDLNVSVVTKEGLARTQTGTPYYASPEI